jgi:pyruvate formate lyase activating enzyme
MLLDDRTDGARPLPPTDAPGLLQVGGFVPFTATDYPDALSAVIFCQGCPWRCGYCHNPHLIAPRGDPALDFAEVLRWLDTRRGLLDAVVFSGGEPTAQAALPAAAASVRALGFLVGLHTSGAYPRRLAGTLQHVDWVGLDIKAPRAHYAEVTGVAGSGDAPLASLDLIRQRGIAFEVRTTVHPRLTPPAALVLLAQELAQRDVVRWVLQPFRPTGCASDALVADAPQGAALDPDTLARLSEHVPILEVRG